MKNLQKLDFIVKENRKKLSRSSATLQSEIVSLSIGTSSPLILMVFDILSTTSGAPLSIVTKHAFSAISFDLESFKCVVKHRATINWYRRTELNGSSKTV